MLYRVYTRSSRLNAAKQIHTSQLAYVHKLKPSPRKCSRPSVVRGKVEEEVVPDDSYGEYYTLLLKRCLSSRRQSNGTS